MLVQGRQAPLVSFVALFCVLVLYELVTFLVDGVIREVGKLVGFDVMRVVLFTSETGEALVENVDSPGVHRRDQNIDPDIEFQPVYQ